MVLKKIPLALYILSFAIVLLADGGVYPLSLSLAVIAMALATIGAASWAGMPGTTRRIFSIALLLWVTLVLWICIQTIPLPGGWLGKPAWTVLGEAGLEVAPRISVVPGDALYSLLPVSLSFMAFLATLLLFRTDQEVERALRIFGIVGGALAVFAVVQTAFFPHTLMFGPKQSYIGSLTAPFVNRNTAATFYGLVLVVLLGCYALSASESRRLPDRMPSPWFRHKWTFAILAVFALVAVAMTQSRGGAAATLVGCMILIPALASHFRARRSMRRRHAVPLPATKMLGFTVLVAVVIVIAGAFVFGRSFMRAERQGLDDSRFCVTRSVLPAVADNWSTGLGPSSFRYYFPAYRDSACGLEGNWYRAHDFYLEAVWSLGVVAALAAFLVAYGALISVFMTGLRMRKSRKPITWTGISALTVVGIHSVVDFSLQIPAVAAIFAFHMALATTTSGNRSRFEAACDPFATDGANIKFG